MKTAYRSHTCGELGLEHLGQEVTLSGWLHNVRDLGHLLFFELRDHYGIVQVVCEGPLVDAVKLVSKESSIQIKGIVAQKPGETKVEIKLKSLKVLSKAEDLPFHVNQDSEVSENLRLQYRFLHLRRLKQHNLISERCRLIKLIREILFKRKFLEIHTPILTGPTPEGARDYLVPSRRYKGRFYALPQAPQQFKQLLMMSGFDRYFQIAPCFRDEDPRADRHSGEFYQIDAEMAFVDQEDVLSEFESFFIELIEAFGTDRMITKPFYRFNYTDICILTGSDKPDLRAQILYKDITELSDLINLETLKPKINQFLACLMFKVDVFPSRKILDEIVVLGKNLLQRDVFYLLLGNENKGSLQKWVSEHFIPAIKTKLNARDGENYCLFFLIRNKDLEPNAEAFRVEVCKKLGCFMNDLLAFCWITDFPFYELDEEGKLQFCHNPFSMPQGGYEALTYMDPLKIKAFQYDLALNGFELSSGAIRNHEYETLIKAFELVGYSKEKVLTTFPGIFRALKYGPPPHGGMAPGLERLMMILFNEPNVREVIPFPLTQNGIDLLMNAPASVDEERLKELGIYVLSHDNLTKDDLESL